MLRMNGRKIFWTLWIGLVALTIATHVCPIRTTEIRVALLFEWFTLWASLLMMLLRNHPAPALLLIAFAGCLVALGAPGHHFSGPALRDQYIRSMVRYVGTRYVVNGETRTGMDSAGLVRTSLADAALEEGLRTANPELIRVFRDVWFNDSTAEELRTGYMDMTTVVGRAPSLTGLRVKRLQPGDMVVFSHGGQVIAYLGAGRFIAALPEQGRLKIVKWPLTRTKAWRGPVVAVRWRIFQ